MKLLCSIFGHRLVHTSEDACDGRCDPHEADCPTRLPIRTCTRCWAEFRKGREHNRHA